MGKYTLKIKHKNGVELSIESKTPEIIARELDSYLGIRQIEKSQERFFDGFPNPALSFEELRLDVEKEELKKSPKEQNETFEVSTDSEKAPEVSRELDPEAALDELIFFACDLSENLDIKDFTLKYINSKIYPEKQILIGHTTVEHAISLGILDSFVEFGVTKYFVTDNGFEYRNIKKG